MLVQAQVVPWWGTGRPAEFSPRGSNPVTGIAYRQEDRRVRLLNRVDLATACGQPHTLSGNEKFEFFGAPSPGGRSVREITSREETERPPEESTRQIRACRLSQNRKPAGDLARQIEPPPSRSGRHLDYESSGSPSPSRSYRRPETESLPVTEVTGSNLRHARPGAGRALVGNGETGRVQSQRIQPVTGIAYRQEDRRGGLQNRVGSTTPRPVIHPLSRN